VCLCSLPTKVFLSSERNQYNARQCNENNTPNGSDPNYAYQILLSSIRPKIASHLFPISIEWSHTNFLEPHPKMHQGFRVHPDKCLGRIPNRLLPNDSVPVCFV
ncbi:hypothetical protein BLOT_005449, partial [Blomia tropicalis]